MHTVLYLYALIFSYSKEKNNMAKKNMELYVSRGTHESGNFAELTVIKKPQGKYLLFKILRVVILIAWMVGCLAVMFLGKNIAFIFVGGIFLASGSVIVWNLSSPLGLTEYRYSILAGEMIVDKFLGGRIKKEEILKIHVGDMELIAPYHSDKQSLATDSSIENVYDICSTLDEPDVYFALFTKDGKKSVIFFDATQKALKIMKFLNKDAIIMKDVRR